MIHDALRFLRAHAADMRDDLRRLVELESPSDDADALHRCAAFLEERARGLTGARVRMIDDVDGPHLDVVIGDAELPPVLLLGHFDTVWPVGTLADRPYRDDGHVARGPGVFDMKAGIVQGLWAVRAHQETHTTPTSARLLLNSDEEIQSVRSRALIEAAARQAHRVLVLEPSQRGALKTARKGVGRFHVAIRGRAAHAGVEPHLGRSAIAELARVVEQLHALTDSTTGTTVNVGVVSGGTRANVVASDARAEVDVRVASQAEAERITRLIRELRPSTDGVDLEITGGIVRPPMQRTDAIAALFDLAKRLGDKIGLDLNEVATGGGSDANFCAALGVPVLDGLGAVGGGAHGVDEHVLIDSMPARAALVAGLIDACCTG